MHFYVVLWLTSIIKLACPQIASALSNIFFFLPHYVHIQHLLFASLRTYPASPICVTTYISSISFLPRYVHIQHLLFDILFLDTVIKFYLYFCSLKILCFLLLMSTANTSIPHRHINKLSTITDRTSCHHYIYRLV